MICFNNCFCCQVNLLIDRPQAGRASWPQRRCVLLLGFDSTSVSFSSIAFVSGRIKLTQNKAAYAAIGDIVEMSCFF